ncbi:MAG: AraC family transcriptional regulator [Herbinix sp.]|nr:AraC family transcriptional regulator [Herbinix sp.]
MKNKKVYIRLIITYLAVFLFPVMVNILILEEISESSQDNICQSVLTNLNHTRDIIDNNFKEINTIVENLSANSTIQYIATQMGEEDKSIKISKLLSAQDYMGAMRIQTFVEEYYLIFHETDMIISPDHIYLNAESSKHFFRYGDYEWEDWKEKLEESYSKYIFPEAMTMQNKRKRKMLLYVQSLITNSGTKGNFVFPIKSESIKALLKDTYVANGGWGYLLDSEGETVLSMPSEKDEFELVPQKHMENGKSIQQVRMNGRDVAIIKSVSTKMGLTFVAVLPKKYITAQINEAQKNTLRMTFVVLLVGIGSILALSWYRGRNIIRILQILFNISTADEEMPKGDELVYISNSLQQLVDKNTDLKENIRLQEPITRGLLLERLLYSSEIRNEKSLEEYGIHLAGKRLLVIAFWFGGDVVGEIGDHASEFTVYKQVLQKELDKIIPGEKYLCDTDINAGAIICALEDVSSEENPPWSKDNIFGPIEKLGSIFWKEYGVLVRMAVSNICKELTNISKAYDQVYEMLQYGADSCRKVIFYDDYLTCREYYYFPVSLEDRLVNAVKTGNAENMHAQLTEIYQVNVLERSISPSMMHFLVNDLQCTVFKALHGLNSNIEIEEEEIYKQLEHLNRENDILLRFNRINKIFKYICEKVSEANQANSSKQIQNIENYIKNNYHRSDMSLTKIADDFCFASTYFSKLFKELFQENFSVYLEKVRIEQVCILLKGNDNLEKIAEKTGYNSVYVMRTSFKRMKGMTPNDYRKLNG